MILAVIAALLLLAGLVLLVRGIQQRSVSSTPDVWVPPVQPTPTAPPPPADPSLAPPPAGDFFAGPATPTENPWSSAPQPTVPPPDAAKSAGTPLIVAGAVAMAIAVLVGFAALGNAYPKRIITMPTQLEGNAKNASVSASLRQEFVKDLPRGIKSADAAVFGSPPKLIVVAGVGRLSSPDKEIKAFLDDASDSNASLRNLHDVDSGPLGGKATCGTGTISGIKANVCVFADRGSFFASFEVNANGADADARALDARNQVIQKKS